MVFVDSFSGFAIFPENATGFERFFRTVSFAVHVLDGRIQGAGAENVRGRRFRDRDREGMQNRDSSPKTSKTQKARRVSTHIYMYRYKNLYKSSGTWGTFADLAIGGEVHPP
jgi:hypothetical protein